MYEWVMRTHEWVMSVWYVTGGLCHIRMGHVTSEESWHLWTIHVTSHESRDIWTNRVTYQRVVSHKYEPCQIWRAVSRMSDLCDIEWAMGPMNKSQNRRSDACDIWTGYWYIRIIHVTFEELCHVRMIYVSLCLFCRALLQKRPVTVNVSCHMWRVVSCMNDLRDIRMSHGTYQRVVLRMKELCHIEKSHVKYEESCHVWMTSQTYQWVLSHINKSCLIFVAHFS